MTDRICSLTVVLDRNIREDDVESLVEAIRHFKSVLTVEKDVSDPMAELTGQLRERSRWLEGLAALAYPKEGSEAP